MLGGFASRNAPTEAALGVVPVVFLLVLFLVPVLRFLLLSIEDGSLAHFEKALTDGLHLHVFAETLKIAAIVTLVCLLLGYPLSYWLATTTPLWRSIGFACLLLPFWISVLVRTYAWMILLGRNGVLNRQLMALGVIDAPLPLLHNTTGVIIGMVHVLLPYMVFPLYAVMRRVDPALLSAAEGLGAPGWQVMRRIFLPLTLPGVLSGVTLVFVISLGFFITPALLGGGRVLMVGVLIERHIRQYLDWGLAAALAIIVLVVVLAIYAAMRRLLRDEPRWT
ncbi:MAG: ABC transporter permease [Alphaproteobacteria bacterium]|nr:ABC transporter permease [Alphaproteobacteria bacterium]